MHVSSVTSASFQLASILWGFDVYYYTAAANFRNPFSRHEFRAINFRTKYPAVNADYVYSSGDNFVTVSPFLVIDTLIMSELVCCVIGVRLMSLVYPRTKRRRAADAVKCHPKFTRFRETVVIPERFLFLVPFGEFEFISFRSLCFLIQSFTSLIIWKGATGSLRRY